MKKFNTVDEALDFAIEEERKAARLYAALAEKAKSDALRDSLLLFAAEEHGHEAKLRLMKDGKVLISAFEKIRGLDIADYLVDDPLGANPTLKQALEFAMRKEKAAYKLYSDLAAATKDPEVRHTLQALAAEEAGHKLRFEVSYDREFPS